jgi:hypothetical protein
MMAPHGSTPAEEWVSLGIQAAGLDLVQRIERLSIETQIYVLAAEPIDQTLMQQHGAIVLPTSKHDFHFGQALVNFIREYNLERMAYFGAGSAPLLPNEIIEERINQVIHSPNTIAVVNNLHSTDWGVFNICDDLLKIADRLPSDNQIGWVLQNEFGYDVQDLPISAASRADLDTPVDLLMLRSHPGVGDHLRDFLLNSVADQAERITEVQRIMATAASHLTIIGRASSRVWQEIEKRTQIWTRLFVEERGMVASGRMARGEVQSLVAEQVQQWGPEGFVQFLEEISDAVLWDTRVWMAHQGGWPSKADRFAADLGRVDEIESVPLKMLTQAVVEASIPIITGGHGVVAGGLFALLESV